MSKQADDRGFDAAQLEVGADDALATLTAAGARAPGLVEQWVKHGNVAAVARAADRADGAARKAARRGLNVLKARGISIPEDRRVATLAGARGQESLEAWMMAPDSSGSVLLVIAARSPASRYRAVFVFAHDQRGVHRVETAELSQSQLRESLAKVLPGAQYKPVKVPVEWVRARIARAKSRHRELGVPEPLGFASAQTLLEPVADPPPSHPFDDEGLELADDDARELAKDSASLHRLAEFRGWFPTKGAVDEMLLKLGETLTPGQEPDAEVLKTKLDQEITAATDRYFSPERREELVAAMKDSALSVLAREGEQKALEVAATMKVIELCGLITDPPHEVAFLRGFFEKAVSLLLAQGGGSLRIPIPRGAAEAAESAAAAESDAP